VNFEVFLAIFVVFSSKTAKTEKARKSDENGQKRDQDTPRFFLDFTPKIEKKAPRNASKKYCDFEDVFFVFLALRGRKGIKKRRFWSQKPDQNRAGGEKNKIWATCCILRAC
jgi:hypothetical protein